MSNIFKRLRLMGRREEKEEMTLNSAAEVLWKNTCGPNAPEPCVEVNARDSRGFRHQRPRNRRGARKRLCFSSKEDCKPVVNCAISPQDSKLNPNYSADRNEDAAIIKDSNTEWETNVTKIDAHSSINMKPHADGASDVMNESFEVLMPDLSSSDGYNLSSKKISQECNEATPDPPVLQRMDMTGPCLLSKEDVNLLSKSPATRSVVTNKGLNERVDVSLKVKSQALRIRTKQDGSLLDQNANLPAISQTTGVQARKEEFRLLKLLCSDEDANHSHSVPLLSLSKKKRSFLRVPVPQKMSKTPILKVKDEQKVVSQEIDSLINRNPLNTPLQESVLSPSSFPSSGRSARRRKQDFGVIKDHLYEVMNTPVLKRERLLGNESVSRNGTETEGPGSDLDSDKENKNPDASGGVEREGNDGMQRRKENRGITETKPTNSEATMCVSPDLTTKYENGDSDCKEGIRVSNVCALVQEMQCENETHHTQSSSSQSMEFVESAEVQKSSERSHDEGPKVVLQEKNEDVHIKKLQSKKLQNDIDGSDNIGKQETVAADVSPKVDSVPDEFRGSPETQEMPEGNTERNKVDCVQDTTNDSESSILPQNVCTVNIVAAELTKAIDVDAQKGTGDTKKCNEKKDNQNESRAPKDQIDVISSATSKVGVREAEDCMSFLSSITAKGSILKEIECNSNIDMNKSHHPSSQEELKTNKLMTIKTEAEGTSKDSKIGSCSVNQDRFLCKMENDSRECNDSKITERKKPKAEKQILSRSITFARESPAVTCPQIPATVNEYSPTITPRETYERFATPNSLGNFSGALPFMEDNASHFSRKRGRPKKRMTREYLEMVPFQYDNSAHIFPANNLDWSRMTSAAGSYFVCADGTFVMPYPMPQCFQGQEMYNQGRNMKSSRESVVFQNAEDIDATRAPSIDSGIDSQGNGEAEGGLPLNMAKKENEDDRDNAANYFGQYISDSGYNNSLFPPQYDGLFTIDSAGFYIPVDNSYGMVPPLGFPGIPYDPYGYQGTVSGECYPSQDWLCHNLGGQNGASDLNQDSDYHFMAESSCSILKASAGGDAGPVESTSQHKMQEEQDIKDALKILLRDDFDPSVSDPGELLATVGAELLKDEELRMEFIWFCDQLLNYEMMRNQSGGFFPGPYGDFGYSNPHPHPALYPPPGPYPPGWYPTNDTYFYDGESYTPIQVQPDPQGNLCMVFPNGYQASIDHQGYHKECSPVYAAPEQYQRCV